MSLQNPPNFKDVEDRMMLNLEQSLDCWNESYKLCKSLTSTTNESKEVHINLNLDE